MKRPALILRLRWLAFLALALVGCTSGSAWKRQVFAFSSPADPPAASEPTDSVALNHVSISPLFNQHSFIYRTAENAYEPDPYAGFLIPPERALAEAIRAWMRASGAFGRVLEPGSSLTPTLVAEVSVHELYGDFRHAAQPVAAMEIRFIFCEFKDGNPGRLVIDRVFARQTPFSQRTPGALMAAWDADLREIMEEIRSEYAKANPHK